MQQSRMIVCATLLVSTATLAQNAVPVTVDNFTRAETDHYLAVNAKEAGGLGKLLHVREPVDVDNQPVIRMNRDTLYSYAVFDLAAAPVTITLPDAGKRFMSMMVVNQDHYVQAVYYDHKPHTLTSKNVGTRYAFVAVRTLVDPSSPQDVETVHKLQDGIKVSQKDHGKLDLPNWDQATLKEIHDALLVLAKHASFAHAFGSKAQVNPIHHLIGTASGWGANPDTDAAYSRGMPAKNDGKTVYKMKVPAQVPVDAFWSISVYNAKGYFEKNSNNAYSVNNITAKKDADGGISIQFGGCDGEVLNCIPITDGWSYSVRMYRPRAEILNGKWKFPEAQPAS